MTEAAILIVEDEALIGMELKATLERFGYRVPVVVARGEDVPEAIVVHKPDLILMDIRLKGFQDGIETAYIVGGEFEVPFVFLSAFSDDETLARALGTRAYGYLVKPFEEKSLRTTIELALRRSREYRDRDRQDWYRNVLSRFPRAVVLTDAFGRITFANDAAKSLLPTPGATKIGTALHVTFADAAAVTEALAAAGALKEGQRPPRRTLPLRTGGSLELEVGPFRDDAGKIAGYVFLLGPKG